MRPFAILGSWASSQLHFSSTAPTSQVTGNKESGRVTASAQQLRDHASRRANPQGCARVGAAPQHPSHPPTAATGLAHLQMQSRDTALPNLNASFGSSPRKVPALPPRDRGLCSAPATGPVHVVRAQRKDGADGACSSLNSGTGGGTAIVQSKQLRFGDEFRCN